MVAGGNNPGPSLAHALTLAGMGRWAEAGKAARSFLAQNPDSAPALALLARSQLTLGDPGEALRTAQAALAQDPANASALLVRADSLRGVGDLTAAWQAAIDYIGRFPTDPAGFLAATSVEILLKRPDQARAAAGRAVELRPDQAWPLVNLSRAELAARRWKAAEGAALRALAIDPLSSAAMNNLGVAYQRQRRPLAAHRCFRAAVRLDPSDDLAQNNVWNSVVNPRSKLLGALAAVYLGPLLVLGVLLPVELPRHSPLWVHVLAGLAEIAVLSGLWKLLRWRWSRLDPVLRGVFAQKVGRRLRFPQLRHRSGGSRRG